jgi:hypothetical protein
MQFCTKGNRNLCTSMKQISVDDFYAPRKANVVAAHKRSKRRGRILSFVSILSIYATSALGAFAPSLSNYLSRQSIEEWHGKSVSKNSSRDKIKYISQPRRRYGIYMKKKRPMPVIGYNAKEICDFYDRRPLVVGWRLNKLSLPLLGE